MPRAREDRREIFEFIAHRSPQGAESWELAYEQLLGLLERSPLQFGMAAEDGHFDFTLREAFFRTPRGRRYRLVFRVDGKVVTILRIRGYGQPTIDPDDVVD